MDTSCSIQQGLEDGPCNFQGQKKEFLNASSFLFHQLGLNFISGVEIFFNSFFNHLTPNKDRDILKVFMRFILTTLLILSFSGIAVFGIFAMGHEDGNSHGGCLATRARGMTCPNENDPLSFLTFHLGTFKSFSLTTLNSVLLVNIFFSSLIFLSFISSVFFSISLQPTFSTFSNQWKQFQESRSFFNRIQFHYWLALHENSPTVFLGA